MTHNEALQLFMLLDDWLGQTPTQEEGIKKGAGNYKSVQGLRLANKQKKLKLVPNSSLSHRHAL